MTREDLTPDGASRIYLTDAGLDIEAFVNVLVSEVVCDLAENHMADLDTIAEGPSAGARGRLVSEELTARLVADHRTRIAMSPEQMVMVGRRLTERGEARLVAASTRRGAA